MHKHRKKHISDIVKKSSHEKNEEKAGLGSKVDLATGDISWEAPEYVYEAKTVSWYWLSIIISIILIAISLWQNNFLFVVFIVIAELILIYFSNQLPKVWEFKINNNGIIIGKEKNYKYEDILGFDIHHAVDEYKELVLHLKSKLTPYVKIFIISQDEEKISKKLSEFIQREEIEPSLVDALEKMIRF